MKKRTFIKFSSALIGGTVLSPLMAFRQHEKLKNWAGNIEYSTDKLYYPESFDQARDFVRSHPKIKVLGTRHCFNRIADSRHNLISFKHLDQVLSLDTKASTVTVSAGITYGLLGPYLNAKGFALHNLASLPHISVAGACATGTHGSGMNNGNLSSAVSSIKMLTAEGEEVQLSREKDADVLPAVVVGLGALGVVTQLTLDIEPTYNVRQDVYQDLSLEQLKQHFVFIMSSGYSVSLFTDWQDEKFSEVWIKSRLQEGTAFSLPTEFFGARAAIKDLHPIENLSAENCTEQMGVPGPWFERLPHFKMGFTPSSGKELQSEYFIPRQHAVEAISAIFRLSKQITPQLLISEIRSIAADNLWMSPCYQQACITIHFTWKPNWAEVSQLLPVIEKELSAFHPRPHWGKLFTIPASTLKSRYVKLAEFQQLIMRYDPNGKFRNAFLDDYIYES